MLSVIIPSYNEELNIENTAKVLSALFNENNIETELIFVDDGSKDKTYEKICECAEKYENVVLKKVKVTQEWGRVTLENIPPAIGFETNIFLYNGLTREATTIKPAKSETTSYTYTVEGLLPNTTYELEAKIAYQTMILAKRNLKFTTPQETGTLTLDPASTNMNVRIEGMYNGPNYTRSIVVYYKKSSSSGYVYYTTIKTQGASTNIRIKNLISNVKYDVKVLIKNGSKTLKTLTKSATTTKVNSLVPIAYIDNVVQKLGTKKCTITWEINKSVTGTSYEIQTKKGSNSWKILDIVTAVKTLTYTIDADNENVKFRIIAENSSVAYGVRNISNEFSLYVQGNYKWDKEKTVGVPLVITASEWNRLADYVKARNIQKGNTVTIPVVKAGTPFTAETYNTMKNAISLITPIPVTNKRKGDAVTVADIEALRTAINKA